MLHQRSLCANGRRRTCRRTCGSVTCDSSTKSSQSFGKKSSRHDGVRARLAAREMARVVLDAVAVADLAQHVEVVARALLETLGFEQLAVRSLKILQPIGQFDFDRFDRARAASLRA